MRLFPSIDFRFWKRWRYVTPQRREVLSVSPYIEIWPEFLSPEECAYLIELAQPDLKPSGLTNIAGLPDEQFVGMRTSQGVFLKRQQNMRVSCLEARIAAWVQHPVNKGEPFHVLHYQIGKEYKAHHDYFDPQYAGSHSLLAGGGQRVGTVLLYLSDVERGGETTFPKLKLGVRPKQGAALYFKNCSVGEQIDENSLHASCPVEIGEKWTATKWLRAHEVLVPQERLD